MACRWLTGFAPALVLVASACAVAPAGSVSNDTAVDAGSYAGSSGWPGNEKKDAAPGGGTGGTSGEDAAIVPSGGAPAQDAGIDSGPSVDPFASNRELCVTHINELRATKGLAPYERWNDAEACVDLQVTHDQQVGIPHDAWVSHDIACNGYGMAQNECQGAGGIVGCLNLMWAEKDQPGCAGCDECDSPGGCADCDFFGTTTGDVCGHYVNLRSGFYAKAACGFSANGNWSAINFQ